MLATNKRDQPIPGACELLVLVKKQEEWDGRDLGKGRPQEELNFTALCRTQREFRVFSLRVERSLASEGFLTWEWHNLFYVFQKLAKLCRKVT